MAWCFLPLFSKFFSTNFLDMLQVGSLVITQGSRRGADKRHTSWQTSARRGSIRIGRAACERPLPPTKSVENSAWHICSERHKIDGSEGMGDPDFSQALPLAPSSGTSGYHPVLFLSTSPHIIHHWYRTSFNPPLENDHQPPLITYHGSYTVR